MFVMGTIYSPTGSAPVKIRNLSAGGALVEGGVVPPQGDEVRLSRGALSVVGKVVWRVDMRAGLQFDSRVSVADWLPDLRASGSQQRVDTLVQQIKAAPPSPVTLFDPAPGDVTSDELDRIKKMLESLAEDLADDPEVVGRHASKLQALDLAAQVLGKLGRAAGKLGRQSRQ